MEMLIGSGPFRAGSVLRVTGIRTLREQGALDRNEVYVVGDDAAGWIPEESVGHPADPLR